MTGENRFVFIAPAFNASETIQRMLWSIAGQTYQNWNVIVIDDMSTDNTSQAVENFAYMTASSNCFLPINHIDQFHLIKNVEKKWEVANVLQGLTLCRDDDIICRIDGDDWLTDLDALSFIDQAYKEHNLDALWTAHRWAFSDKNISGPMSPGSDPYKHPWVSSHLKTFRKRLLNDVPYENFLNQNGDMIRRAGDQCLYLPVLHNAKRYGFLPRVMYHYTIDEKGGFVYQTEDAKFQKEEAEYLRKRGYVERGETWQEKIRQTLYGF